MLEDIKSSPVGGEVLTARGDQTYHAVRVKMEIYPEDIYAVWVSVSVRFHKIVWFYKNTLNINWLLTVLSIIIKLIYFINDIYFYIYI